MTETISCGSCGKPVPEGSKACPHCGKATAPPRETIECYTCGETLPINSTACHRCKTSVVRGPPPESGRQPRDVVIGSRVDAKIVGVDIPFGQLVVLLFRIAVASIPAALLFAVFIAIMWAFVGATCAGLGK